MNTFWIKSKWKKDELDHKTVEIRLPSDRGVRHRIGRFWVRQDSTGLLSVEVVARIQEPNSTNRVEVHDFLTQVGANLLERHPDPGTAEFRLAW